MTELAVLVPVLNRPQNVAPLVESFLAHCPSSARMFFIVDEDDTAELQAVAAVGRQHLLYFRNVPGEPGTWPQKINAAVAELEREGGYDWYLCAADDIRFHPGWWEATKELRDDGRIGVIGTHDSPRSTGNPRVAAGEHTCHPLIRASYIRDFGTVDEVGKAVHGGYHHWFVDDELIWTAKYREAWAFCPGAVVEHLHPYWGHAEWDDTYALGEKNNEADMALFKSRAHLFGVQVNA